jgi:ubiquitin carboxyl-terminal hydrolase 22/27/51
LEDIRAPNRKKRKYSAAMSDTDKKFIAINTTTTPCGATGLRGFYNMGQTCFMSVILQSLMHNPLIKSYYLQEGHRATDCEREACTSCAFDEIIQDFFATEKHEGYGAVHMLQACWKGGGGLAGYSQQDAHEFLGFLLNSLHEADINDESKQDAQNCECVIHQTFSGMMRSTVTCNTCKNTTATSEPFMDLSLDVKNAGTRTIKKKLGMINGTQTIKEAIPVDLTECLERFTTAETLSSDSYQCRKCNAAREAKKKLSLVQLPPTIPIHLKRFSHSKANSQSTKVDSRVRFPFRLNLEPYIAKASAKEANGRESVENDGDATDGKKAKKDQADGSGDTREAIYELASVVVHKGKIDNGHYISYSRQDREWFRFDDSMVVQVDEREVLGAEAYMLFYIVSEV